MFLQMFSDRVLSQMQFTMKWFCFTEGGGGGVLPIMAYMGGLRPKGVGVLLVEKNERIGMGLWKGLKGLTDKCRGFIKLRKRSIFAIDSYFKCSAFTAIKMDAKF